MMVIEDIPTNVSDDSADIYFRKETEMGNEPFLKQGLRKSCTDADIRLKLACYVHLIVMTGFSL